MELGGSVPVRLHGPDADVAGFSSARMASTGANAGRIYFFRNNTDQVVRIENGGSSPTVIAGPSSIIQSPRSIALEESGGRIYCGDAGTDDLFSCLLDGTDVQSELTGRAGLINVAAGGGRVFFTDNFADTVEELGVGVVASGINSLYGCDVDPARERVFYVLEIGTPSTSKYFRVNYDGSEQTDMIGGGGRSPRGVVFNPNEGAEGALYAAENADVIARIDVAAGTRSEVRSGLLAELGESVLGCGLAFIV